MSLRLLFGGLILAAAFLAFGERPTVGTAEPFRPPLDKAKDDNGRLVSENCRAHGKRVEPLVCVYGKKRKGKTVVLFGDSHALQWGPALIPLAKKRDWKLITVLRSGCPIANVVAESRCARWRGKAIRRIEQAKPDHIILSTSIGNRYRLKHGGRNLSRKASEPRLRSGMERTIRRLQKIRSLVKGPTAITLIRDQVTAPFVPADCIRKNGGRPEKCAFRSKRRWAPGFDWIAAKRTGTGFTIDPVKALCGRRWCSPTEGRILKYRDSDHLTATYARTLSGWLEERLGIK